MERLITTKAPKSPLITASTVYWKSIRATTTPRHRAHRAQPRGLKKLCALQIHRDTSVCRRYRLNLKFADRRHRREAPELDSTDINTELMKKFNWIPKMLDQVVSNKTSSNRRMTQSMNVIAREILGPVHTEKILNKTRINAANLRQKCIENGTVASPLLRKSRSFQTNQVENELRGVYNIGKDVSYKAQPKIKDVKPGERFKTEDTTLISLLGLLLGNVCPCYTLLAFYKVSWLCRQWVWWPSIMGQT